MEILDNVTTSDDYTAANTIANTLAETLTYRVANASVYAQFKPIDSLRNDLSWGDEILITPEQNIVQACGGFRVRSAIAGTPAQVNAQLAAPGDPQLGPGASFGPHVSADGGVSSPVSLQTGDYFESAAGGTRDGAVLADGTHYNSVADPSFVNLYNRIGIDYGGTGPNDFAVPDRRGRVSVMVGTHADVNAVTDNEGLAVGSRTPKHRHTVTDPGHDHSISTGVGPDSGIGGGGGNRPGSFDPIVANTTGISVGPAGSPLDGPAYQPVYVYIVK